MDITTHRGYERWVSDAFDLDDDLSIGGDFFSRAEVAKLRDHLNTLLGDAPAAKAETVAVEVGREYRLLPGAHYSHGDTEGDRIFTGATRVKVEARTDGDGDAYVRVLDGTYSGEGAYVLPKYLAPLDDPKPSPDVAQAAREVARMYHDAKTGFGPDRRLYAHIGEAFATLADLLEGKSL